MLDRLLWVRCGDERAPGVKAQVSGKAGGTGILGCSLPSRDREETVQPVDVDIPEEGMACRAPTTEKSSTLLRGSTEQRFNRSAAYGSRFTVHERQAWQAVNLVAAAGGFGPIVLDLGELSQRKHRQWQNRQWMRLLLVMEDSSTALLIISTQHLASTVSGLVFELSREKTDWAEKQGFSFLLNGSRARGGFCISDGCFGSTTECFGGDKHSCLSWVAVTTDGYILSSANLWKRSYIDITGQAQRPALQFLS